MMIVFTCKIEFQYLIGRLARDLDALTHFSLSALHVTQLPQTLQTFTFAHLLHSRWYAV